MKKILIMNNEMVVGGTEKVLLTLLKYIDKNKFDITILLPSPGDEWECKIPNDVKIKYLFKKNPRDFHNIWQRLYQYVLWFMPSFILQKIFIRDEYDIYVSFKPSMIDYLRGAKGKKICWVHETYEKESYRYKNLIKKIWKKYTENILIKNFKKCQRIVCVSETSRQAFLDRFGIEEKKVITLYNPNDIEIIKELSNERIELNINNGITMCAVGRMHPVKAFDRLINISNKLKSENIKFNLIIVGDGEQYEEIKLMVEKFKLQDNIHLIGYDENPYKYISKSDFMVCSSLSEAFSTAATESLILGIPIVTTLCSGMEEMLSDKKCGIITKNNEEDLYYGIKNVITNKELLESLKINAICRSNDFNTIDLVKKIEDMLYED